MLSTRAALQSLASLSDSAGGPAPLASLSLPRLLPSLAAGLSSKSPAGKKAAKDSCGLLAGGLGADLFLQAVAALSVSSLQASSRRDRTGKKGQRFCAKWG